MQFFLRHKILVSAFALLLVGGTFYTVLKPEAVPDWVTGTIEHGSVRELVSVSGVIESEGEASLSFPVSGIVDTILVREGDVVAENQTLATLAQSELLAERRDAEAALAIARADRDELLRGPRAEERSVTDATVAIAEADLARTISEEAKKVANAYRTLLSSDLEALPTNANTAATPPLISGAYTCDKEGAYTIEVFRSGAKSGFSYRLSGLESGTYTAFTDAPAPLGMCGLQAQFIAGESYGTKSFAITIPNTRGSGYTQNMNAYLLARENERNAVAEARDAFDKATREAALENAAPRSEALARANATVAQSEARLAQIDARIHDRTLRAPFPGTVSDIRLVRGEVASGVALTLVASDRFELTVRIPEIDITRVALGQRAEVRFDAEQSAIVPANVVYIAPIATMIDGVAYFEAKLHFPETPTWMRSGLNADVDIIVEERPDTLKVPKRFVVSEGDAHFLLYPDGTVTRKEKVDIVFTGNDGYMAIDGNVREGDTIVAP